MRLAYSKFAKKFPPLFDASKRAYRLLGNSDPVYETLKHFARAKAHVSFLQIGSNDGITQDPLREFIVRHPNWSGCFVEPLPHLFAQLQRNYAYLRRDNLRYENVAVSDRAGELELFRIKDEWHAEFPSFVDGIASTNRAHLDTVFPGHLDLERKVERVRVKALPIAEIAAPFRESGIDLLHLDVEGHEAVILHGFPFEAYSPEIIIFEAGHLAAADKQSIGSLLSGHSYKIYDAGIDAIALKAAAGRQSGVSLGKPWS